MEEEFNFKYQLSRRLSLGKSPAINTASLIVCNGLRTPAELFGQVDECADCALKSMIDGTIDPGDNNTALVLTSIYAYRLELRLSLSDSSLTAPVDDSCRFHVHLEDFGEYSLNVGHYPNCGGLPTLKDGSLCEWRQLKAGSSALIPLFIVLASTLVGFPLLSLLSHWLLRAVALWRPALHSTLCSVASYMADPRASTTNTGAAGDGKAVEDGGKRTKRRLRVRSVDVLRGAAIAIMILNYYGDLSYALLDHATWNGLQLSDLAFPSFMFVMGISIAITNRRDACRIKEVIYGPLSALGETNISTNKYLKRGALEFAKLIYRILWRSFLLFGIGLSLANVGIESYQSLRIFDVLQRLSLTYLITSLITLPVFFRYAPHTTAAANGRSSRTVSDGILWDVTRFWPEWIPVLALVALQTGLEFGIDPANWNATSVASMKDCPRGYLGPGGLHWNGSYPNCTGGAHRLVDLYLLGEQHLLNTPYTVINFVYLTTVPFESVGVLGTCCSVLLCFLGLQAGKVLLFSHSDRERAIRWTMWAVFFVLITLPLVLIPSPYPYNASLLPINWSLCTASFALAVAAIDTALLELLYFLADVLPKQAPNEQNRHLGEGQPSFISRVMSIRWPLWSGAPLTFLGANPILLYVVQIVFQKYLPLTLLNFLPNTRWGNIAYSLWGLSFWMIVAYVLHRKKIFLSI